MTSILKEAIGDDDSVRVSEAEMSSVLDHGQEHLYQPSEIIFGRYGPALARNGWAVFPQTADEKRQPGSVNNIMIKWSTEERLPYAPKDEEEEQYRTDKADEWAEHCAGLNVACALGPGSGHVIAIDVDVTDEEASDKIQELAEDILGPTPLQRIGRFPKIVLLYRQDPEDSIPNYARKFAAPEGESPKDQDGIDILSEGKAVTFFGRHHKTGRYFVWPDKSPIDVKPEDVPVVSNEQVAQWIEKVDQYRKFHRNPTFDSGAQAWDWDDTGPINVPKIRLVAGGDAWVEDPETGLVVDGREAYLRKIVWHTVRANASKNTEELAQNITEQFERAADMSGRWTRGRVLGDARAKVQALKAKIDAGKVSRENPGAIKGMKAVSDRDMDISPSHGAKGHRGLEYLPPIEMSAGDAIRSRIQRRKQIPLRVVEQPPEDYDASEPDPGKVRENVAGGIQNVLEKFFDEVYQCYASWRVVRAKGGFRVDEETGEEFDIDVGEWLPVANGLCLSLPTDIIDSERETVDLVLQDTQGREATASISFKTLLAQPYVSSSIVGPASCEIVSNDGRLVVRLSPGDPPPAEPRVHILKAPTGAGKTSKTIAFIANDKRRNEHYPYYNKDGDWVRGRAPMLFMLPTYNNIEELRHRSQALNLDPDASDDELRRDAERAGLIKEDDLEERLAELRRDAASAGLKTMVYRGKIAAGCQMAEKVQIAMSAGIGTASLCESQKTDPDTGEKESIYCPFYHGCPAIKQRDEIAECDVVFLPHAFMSLSIPEELKNVRCVIADERIHHLFLHTTTFSFRTLAVTKRRTPKLTKKEREEGRSPEELQASRNKAAEIASHALVDGICPARALFEYQRPGAEPQNGRWGLELVQEAIRVCTSGLQRDGTITPETTEEELLELCEQPTGIELREEHRFWAIIKERIEAMQRDALLDDVEQRLSAYLERTDLSEDDRAEHERELERYKSREREARGEHEYRIQFLQEKATNGEIREKVRISWRTEPNWIDKPMLLLDASAAPEIIKKIWHNHSVVEHDIDAFMRVRTVGVIDRTYSNSSLVGSPDMSRTRLSRCAKLLANVRDAISAVSSLYADGRVVAGGSIIVRRAINNMWAGPENVDWCHYGAMRGLDFAKYHSAAVSIGRMEVPYRSIDGLVAALTYDDHTPEDPFDKFGNGNFKRDGEGAELKMPMEPRQLRMRSGHVIEVQVPMYPGKWARLIQKQYREEELLQFVGRLRPVYRDGEMPVWFALSSVIPEEMVVDDVIHLDDLLSSGHGNKRLAEASRRLNGVVDSYLISLECGDLFEGRDQVMKLMDKVGFSNSESSASQRVAYAYVKIPWREVFGTNRWRIAYVAAHKRDPKDILAGQIERVLGIDESCYELGEVGDIATHTLAREREPDKIEEDLGPREARLNAEYLVRDRTNTDLSKLGSMDQGSVLPRAYPAGEDESLLEIQMTAAAWEARTAVEDLWRRLAPEVSDTKVGEVIEDGSEVYDQLGKVVVDADLSDEIPW